MSGSGYGLGSVHSLLGDITAQFQTLSRNSSCANISDLNVEVFGNQNKDYLAQQLFACTQLLGRCQTGLQFSSVEVDRMQNVVISLQSEKIATMTEINSSTTSPSQSLAWSTRYSDTLQQSSSITPVTQRTAPVTPVRGDGRDQNVMLFGVAEQQDEDTKAVVEDIFSGVEEKQYFVDCVRVGKKGSGGKSRPIKVRMRNANSATQAIVSGRKLRGKSETEGVYIAPDRTPEQRAERRRLVAIMRERRKSDPSHFHCIRRGTVLSRDRFVSASEAPEGDPDISTEPARGDQLSESDDDQGSECSSASSLCYIPFTAKQEEALRKHREQNALETRELLKNKMLRESKKLEV